LAIDAFRTLFESFYYGIWHTSRSGFFPEFIYPLLTQPQLFIIPKLVNLVAALLVFGVVLRKLIPAIIQERDDKEKQIVKLEAEISKRREIEKELEAARQKAETMAEQDGLTGLANRHQLTKVLQHEFDRAIRNAESISLLMLDIDFFKNFNDAYGHLMGDEVLKIVSKTIEDAFQRPADFVSRYGGEEFLIILPQTDYKGAFEQAENLRKLIETLKIKDHTSDVETSVTVSIGINSQIPQSGQSAEDQLNKADQALYQAKNQGRNQVV